MIELVLASGSQTRRHMLEAAGVRFRVMPADVDEDAIRTSLGDTDPPASPAALAQALADAKAAAVSRLCADALVIGADQILALGQEVFTKPADLAAARSSLRRLAGATHRLHSGVALASGGQVVWRHVDTASLSMRAFSDGFLDAYLAQAGDRVCASVGGYELEGLGIQLFERIEGDYFTILGLPLLPLLAELRRRGVIPA